MVIKNPDMLTMSVEGIVTDISKKVNRVFANYLRSFYSQSTVYLGRVKSLSHDAQMHGNSPDDMATAVKLALEELYAEYFATVNINVTTVNETTTSPEYRLVISGTVDDGNNSVTLNKTLDFDSGILQEIEEDNGDV